MVAMLLSEGHIVLSSEEKSLGLFFHCGPKKVFGSEGPRLGVSPAPLAV